MGLYAIEHNYDLTNWYNSSGAYDLWTGTDLMLDLSREILRSDSYIFQGVAFPKGNDINVAGGQTFSGTLNLIPYSYIISVTGWSGNGNQFTLRLFDKGAQTDVYQKQFAWFPTAISNMVGEFNLGQVILIGDRDKPFGPYFFRDPLIVLPPGVLQIQVTNVGPGPFSNLVGGEPPEILQLFFNVAVPKNTQSLQTQKIGTHTDQTGTQTLQGITSLQNLLGM